MKFHLGMLCFGGVLLASSSCLTAPLPTIEPVQGNLYVSTGQGFQPVNGRIDANVGDTAMVSPGGSAVAVYPDGCKVAIQPGDVVTINRLSPCTNPFPRDGTFAQEQPSINYALAWGITGTVLGAVGLGVGIYAIVNENNKTTPAQCGMTVATQCFVSP